MGGDFPCDGMWIIIGWLTFKTWHLQEYWPLAFLAFSSKANRMSYVLPKISLLYSSWKKKIHIQKLYFPKWSSIFFGRFNATKYYEINLWGLNGTAQQCWPLSLATAAAWLFTLTPERGRPCREQGHTVGGPSIQTNKYKTPPSLVISKPTEFSPSWLKANKISYFAKYPQTTPGSRSLATQI